MVGRILRTSRNRFDIHIAVDTSYPITINANGSSGFYSGGHYDVADCLSTNTTEVDVCCLVTAPTPDVRFPSVESWQKREVLENGISTRTPTRPKKQIEHSCPLSLVRLTHEDVHNTSLVAECVSEEVSTDRVARVSYRVPVVVGILRTAEAVGLVAIGQERLQWTPPTTADPLTLVQKLLATGRSTADVDAPTFRAVGATTRHADAISTTQVESGTEHTTRFSTSTHTITTTNLPSAATRETAKIELLRAERGVGLTRKLPADTRPPHLNYQMGKLGRVPPTTDRGMSARISVYFAVEVDVALSRRIVVAHLYRAIEELEQSQIRELGVAAWARIGRSASFARAVAMGVKEELAVGERSRRDIDDARASPYLVPGPFGRTPKSVATLRGDHHDVVEHVEGPAIHEVEARHTRPLLPLNVTTEPSLRAESELGNARPLAHMRVAQAPILSAQRVIEGPKKDVLKLEYETPTKIIISL
ncbi:hypothetical protein FIBSPDRAFT_888924 [Athelia psychrophila]|uniref:Uncharacterized protein n=1 Tax=Athelia psychrophila TaxID=1759441 RepID=A0A166N039_9AGAM|nr:hypothetical protein FIBSPDRAFT_888924 [Fibularhizoctonia sp. CBS 109695]